MAGVWRHLRNTIVLFGREEITLIAPGSIQEAYASSFVTRSDRWTLRLAMALTDHVQRRERSPCLTRHIRAACGFGG
jgi:hypothetical protein